MVEKTDWEVIDAPQTSENRRFSNGNTMQQLLSKLLGQRWRWKMAGIAVVGALAVMIVVALSLMFAILMAAGAVAVLLVTKLRQWWVRSRHIDPHANTDKAHEMTVRTMHYRRH